MVFELSSWIFSICSSAFNTTISHSFQPCVCYNPSLHCPLQFLSTLCSPPLMFSVFPQTVPHRQDGIMSPHSWCPALSQSHGSGLINVCGHELN